MPRCATASCTRSRFRSPMCEACNSIGQQYGGPVVLVGDSTTYSAGRSVLGGVRRQRDRPVRLRGRGHGRRRRQRVGLRRAAVGARGFADRVAALPDGIGLSLSYRRATRSGPSEGLPIEDIGVAGDILRPDPRRPARRQPRPDRPLHRTARDSSHRRRMSVALDRPSRTITVTTTGLSRVDALFDGHPGTSTSVTGNATTTSCTRQGPGPST